MTRALDSEVIAFRAAFRSEQKQLLVVIAVPFFFSIRSSDVSRCGSQPRRNVPDETNAIRAGAKTREGVKGRERESKRERGGDNRRERYVFP